MKAKLNCNQFVYHQTETVIGDDGDEDQQDQSDTKAGSDQCIRNSNNATANDGIYVIKRCLRKRWEWVVGAAAKLLVLLEMNRDDWYEWNVHLFRLMWRGLHYALECSFIPPFTAIT